MNLNLFIHAAGAISAAGSYTDTGFGSGKPDYHATSLTAQEPGYTGLIPPMQLRRMSKAVRMGIGASKQCLAASGLEKPDAIAVGTAMGCLYDTEIFLSKMIAQDEQMLTPTSFIQSTHNTVAGQIALLTGCMGHNLTFSHRGHSLEHAVLDAQLYLHAHPAASVLAGGIDELTPTSLSLMQRSGIYTVTPLTADDVLHGRNNGAVAGEGASFLLLRNTPAQGSIAIRSMHSFVARDKEEVLNQLEPCLKSSYDLALLGLSGDKRSAPIYDSLQQGALHAVPQAAFKHLCGEWATAGAFALSFAAGITRQSIPPEAMLHGPAPTQLRNILVVNHFMDYWSCWHLEVL